MRFRDHRVVGEILELAARYRAQGADELVFYDIAASPQARSVDRRWVTRVARILDIPFCVAGGIATLEDAEYVLAAGAEKVSINSPALADPALIGRLAETRAWPADLFAGICREVVETGALINSAASEPSMGSPSRGGLPGTTAVRTADGWRINGRKNWTSLAPALRWFVIMATVEEEGQPPRRANFLVEAGTPGLRVEETWDNLELLHANCHRQIHVHKSN